MNVYFYALVFSALVVFGSSICILYSVHEDMPMPVNILTSISVGGAMSFIIFLAALIKLDKNTPIAMKSNKVKIYNVTTDRMPDVPVQEEI